MDVIRKVLKRFSFHNLFKKKIEFAGSNDYQEKRYQQGGNSGNGSYDILAEFKAEIINKFVNQNEIETVIEFGSEDGNQLRYFDFRS